MNDKFKVDIRINRRKLKKRLYGIFIVDDEDETKKNPTPTPIPKLEYTPKKALKSCLRKLIDLQDKSDNNSIEKKKEIEDEEKAVFYKSPLKDVFCGKGNISSIDNYSSTCVAPNFKVNKCARDVSDILNYSQNIPYELKTYLNKQFVTKKSENLFYSSPNNCMLACNYARKAALNDPITYKDYYCNSVVYIPPNKTDPGKCFFRNEKESNPFKQEKCQSYKHAITYSSFFNEPYLNDSTKLQYDMNKCDMNTSYELSSPNVYINKSEPIIITAPTPNPCDLIPKPICPTPCPQNNCPIYSV